MWSSWTTPEEKRPGDWAHWAVMGPHEPLGFRLGLGDGARKLKVAQQGSFRAHGGTVGLRGGQSKKRHRNSVEKISEEPCYNRHSFFKSKHPLTSGAEAPRPPRYAIRSTAGAAARGDERAATRPIERRVGGHSSAGGPVSVHGTVRPLASPTRASRDLANPPRSQSPR